MTIISFSDILYSVLIQPLQIVFEIIYGMAFDIYNSHVLSILALSVAMNFLVLPLYRRADAMQDEEREIEAKLSAGVEHIKKTFKGDEKMMMLQTYYRQNNYKPIYALKGATSLLLQIPFFIASYDFDIAKNNGNQYLPAIWFSVHDSIWEHKNWKCVSKKATLTKEDLE